MMRVDLEQFDCPTEDYDGADDIEYADTGAPADEAVQTAFFLKPMHIEAIPALYAFLWYDGLVTPGEKAALGSLYIECEDRGRKKFFKYGKLNNLISSFELAAAKQVVKKLLVPALGKMGRPENIALILYGFRHIHGVESSFVKALQKYGFIFNENDFTSTENAIYDGQGFGFFLLPNYQLEMIIIGEGETKAFLSNGPLYDNNEPFNQRAVKTENGADFSKTVRSAFPKMREAWNKWIKDTADSADWSGG